MYSEQFRIFFHKYGDNQYQIITLSDGGTPVIEEFIPPYPDEKLELILKLLEIVNRPRHSLSQTEKISLSKISFEDNPCWIGGRCNNDVIKYIGWDFFKALFPGEIGNLFKRARQSKAGLRISIEFDLGSQKVMRYPWEIARTDINSLPLINEVPISRFIYTDNEPNQVFFNDVIQILFVAPRPQGFLFIEESDASAISAMSKDFSQHIKMTNSPGVYLAFIDNLIDKRPDIVHFDGHGIYGRFCPICKREGRNTFVEWWRNICDHVDCDANLELVPNQGYLIFETEEGKADYIQAKQIAEQISGLGIKAVVFGACQTANIGPRSTFDNIAPLLSIGRIPIVLAMQFSIKAFSASIFSKRFYKSLALGKPPLDAIHDARHSLDTLEQFRPVLFMGIAVMKRSEYFKEKEIQGTVFLDGGKNLEIDRIDGVNTEQEDVIIKGEVKINNLIDSKIKNISGVTVTRKK